MRISLLCLSLVSFVCSTYAVFADEAYKVDYHHALLGIPQQHTTFFHRPPSASRASLLYTLSEKLILGAINPKDGAVVWRQSVRPTSNATDDAYLRVGENEDSVISAVGGEVRAWDTVDGKLIWARGFSDNIAKGLEVIELADGTQQKKPKDTVALFARERGGILRRLNGASGEVLWEYEDQSGDIPIHVSSSTSTIYLISVQAGKAAPKTRVTSLDPVTGKQIGQYPLSTDSDVTGVDSILHAGANSASPIIAWTDKASRALKVNVLGSKHVSSFNIENGSGEEITKTTIHSSQHAQSLCHFLVHFETAKSHWAEVYHVDISKGAVAPAYKLPQVAGRGVFSTSTQDANVYFTRHTESDVILVSSSSHGILGRWPLLPPTGPTANDVSENQDAIHAVSEVVSRSGTTFSVRSALTLSTGDWVLVRKGEVDWRRNEALGGAIAAEWVELNEMEDLAKELEVEGHVNILSAYIHRVKRHANDLKRLPSWVESLTGVEVEPAQKPAFVRDSFGFHKLVVVATDNGRLYALNAADHGRIVWTSKAIDLSPGEKWHVRGILADPVRGTITVKGSAGDFVMVDAATGKSLNSLPLHSSQPVESAIIIKRGPSDAEEIMEIYEDGDPGDIPSVSRPRGDPVLVVRTNDGTLRGIRYLPTQQPTTEPTVVWEFVPAPGSNITRFIGRSTHDPVASIGRVLGNRSVMYKYLNPNLLLVTTIDPSNSAASFHILDGVSGNTLYSSTHNGVDVSRQISSAMSENWFVYSFWGQHSGRDAISSDSKGYQLVVAEVFESELPNDRGPLGSATNFSSVEPSGSDAAPAHPYVVSQSFLIPQEISNLAITQTRQGITSRSVLATLASSNAIVAIPRSLIDPRRPVGRDPTPAELEEGLGKYMSFIDFDPKWIITHQQEVMGVKKIITHPALLESTSLVFAYGLDIFGTRVAPSMAFDILGNGFAKGQLLLTVVGLGVGVLVLAPTVRRKQINAQWQVS
ncbi:MAG: DUF1620 super [Sclerophora amabilis]|nr:MAG: DUF1620 super [Sclerophora amabilis]